MNQKELYNSLDYVDHSREKRSAMAQEMLNDPKLMVPLMEIIKLINDPVSCKACWILERVVRMDRTIMIPHLDAYTQVIGKVHLDSAVRPIAKVCEILIEDSFGKDNQFVACYLSPEHLELMTTACFDWLIGNHKVAAQAYSMTSLYLLGRKNDWIHPELRLILEQNYATGSAAYQARARRVLKQLG